MPHPPAPYCSHEGCLNRSMLAGLCQHHAEKEMNCVERPEVTAMSLHDSRMALSKLQLEVAMAKRETRPMLAAKYPQYYKVIPKGMLELDTYALNMMFPISSEEDPTGTILHARKKLLIPGVRSGGKSFWHDIKEARDTLNRFLELTPEPVVPDKSIDKE